MTELEKKLIVIQSMLDSFGLRINQCELNSKQALDRVLDKPERKDVYDVKEELIKFKQSTNLTFNKHVDLDSFNKLKDTILALRKTSAHYVTQADFEQRLANELSQSRKTIEDTCQAMTTQR